MCFRLHKKCASQLVEFLVQLLDCFLVPVRSQKAPVPRTDGNHGAVQQLAWACTCSGSTVQPKLGGKRRDWWECAQLQLGAVLHRGHIFKSLQLLLFDFDLPLKIRYLFLQVIYEIFSVASWDCRSWASFDCPIAASVRLLVNRRRFWARVPEVFLARLRDLNREWVVHTSRLGVRVQVYG